MGILGYIFMALVFTIVVSTSLRIDFVLSWLISVNLVAFFVYRHDKKLAQQDKWRIAEKILLSLAWAGGTPGALLAMQKYRHKIHKREFLQRFRSIVILHLFLLAVLIYLIVSELNAIS